MKRMLFIYNPKSGKTQIKTHISDVVDKFVKAGYTVEIYPTQSKGDAVQYVANHAVDYDMIVCSGGDGTLNETISGMMQLDPAERRTLGYIPAGTTNDFASSLGISKKIDDAADIVVNGRQRNIDIGEFNGKKFVYVAAFGAFANVSYETPSDLKNVLGHQAYILSGIKEVAQIKPYHVKISADGLLEDIEGEFIYGMITNSKSVGGFKNITGKYVDFDDGLFEVTFVKKLKTILDLNSALSYLTGAVEKSDVVVSFKTAHIKIKSKEETAWSLDGEFGGEWTEVEINNNSHAISIMQSF